MVLTKDRFVEEENYPLVYLLSDTYPGVISMHS